ncbi:MAG: disulfide bond formation protein B [Shimia sp.]
MRLSQRHLIAIAATGSAALLGGAYIFQWLGFAPCQLCLWQRWPHVAAIAIGVVALGLGWRLLPWLGALAAATTAGIGLYHVGVEQDWWEGPASCGGGQGLGGLSGGDLLSVDGPGRVVMCDEVSWALFGLSMPGWNAALSLILAVIWLLAARRTSQR